MANTTLSFFEAFLKPLSANVSLSEYILCLISSQGFLIFTSLSIANTILLLPLCIIVLYHGLQRWRQSLSTATAQMSHSRSFTYHMVFMELISVCGGVLFCCGIFCQCPNMLFAGGFVFAFSWYGQIFVHILTCMERYLAVVHPTIYLSLRKDRGIRVRNVSMGCVWVMCSVGVVLAMKKNLFVITDFFILVLSLIVTSFCSLSVLRVLIRPGPGQHGRDRDPRKLRAFYTILVILGILVSRFAWNLTWVVVVLSGGENGCLMMMLCGWFNLPCSLTPPLLFLHREGKLVCCKKQTTTNQERGSGLKTEITLTT